MIPAWPIPQTAPGAASEGSSTSAREAITILGCRAITSRSAIPRLVPCAVLALRPQISSLSGAADRSGRFLAFVEKLLATRHFDVLLPTHEQGFLFARVRSDSRARRSGAAGFRSYRTAHSKAGFSRLLDRLGCRSRRRGS
jgi:hypothetical protein